MEKNESLERLKEYIERTKEILELSSPQLDGISNAEQYRIQLQKSFQRIGELAQLNNDTLDRFLFPLVDENRIPSDEDVYVMREFSSLLIDPTDMVNFDLPLVYIQAKRMLKIAEDSGDLRSLIIALDNMVLSTYMMLNLTMRLYPELSVCFDYRDEGLAAAKRLHEYLEPEKFSSLPDDECRELVLINSRYIRCLFEWDDKDDKEPYNAKDIGMMKRALDIADDPFYRVSMPDYRWDAHIFRTLQYLADFTEYNNIHEFSKEQLDEIYLFTERLIEFLDAHPELQEGCPKDEQRLYLLRNGYLSGRISKEEYKRELLGLIEIRDINDFSARGMFVTLTVPLEFIFCLDNDSLSHEEKDALNKIYSHLSGYAYHMPKTGVLSFMVSFIVSLLRHYIEVPGGISFKELCLNLMAALHPPTYIHTRNVADIAVRLTGHLLDSQPERFIGINGAATKEDVLNKREEILDFVYNSALMHDVGKLFIVETILTYGRSLLPTEFEIIRTHNIVGAALLSMHDETKEYAEAALGHHRWYDSSAGYPNTLDSSKEKYATIVAIIEVADCLDAATDSIGRSYKKGKSLDDFLQELREGKGTRYAPYIVDLFDDFAVRTEFEFSLPVLRDKNYRETYNTLKTL